MIKKSGNARFEVIVLCDQQMHSVFLGANVRGNKTHSQCIITTIKSHAKCWMFVTCAHTRIHWTTSQPIQKIETQHKTKTAIFQKKKQRNRLLQEIHIFSFLYRSVDSWQLYVRVYCTTNSKWKNKNIIKAKILAAWRAWEKKPGRYWWSPS